MKRFRSFEKGAAPFLVVLGLALFIPPAHAVPVAFDLVGVNDSNNTAHVVFAYDPTLATVKIDITNTSALYYPRLTAFAFNAPAGVTGISSFTAPLGWTAAFALDLINTPEQFGRFDVAAVTGPNFNGGFPNDGIPRGDNTSSFQFVLTGSGLDSLDEMSFLSLLSFDPDGRPDESEQYFIARWQRTGPDGEGSDVGIPAAPVPEPATLLLFGTGLAGLAALIRKKS